VIPKTGQTIESMRVVNFEIHLLPNCNFFLLQVFYNCSIPWILQLLCSLIWILPTHFQSTVHGMKLNEIEWNIDSIFGVNVDKYLTWCALRWCKSSKLHSSKFLHQRQSKSAIPAKHKVKKTFLSTSNVLISQSVWSTFLKLFSHVPLVV
jgi:hypothetical protein